MKIKKNDCEIEIEFCTTFWSRWKGFMFQKEKITTGKVFPHCNSIHTFFMKQKIDILLCDKENRVKKKYENFPKNKVLLPKKGVVTIIELPVGTSQHFEIGEPIHFQ